MKKLEIIIEAVEKKKVCQLLDDLKVSGYTIIDDVYGKGNHFSMNIPELSDILKNSLIIVVEEEEVINNLISKLKTEVLAYYSGRLFLSDAQIID